MMWRRVPSVGQVEMEGLEMDGRRDRSGFCLEIDLTPNSPSWVRKRENSRKPKSTQENLHSSFTV